jgi:Immunity protein 53
MQSTLVRIQRWYASQCNGDWEHASGIKIESLDNPGWLIKINLQGTNLAGRSFSAVAVGLEEREGRAFPSSPAWHSLSVKDHTFEAAGDPSKLEFLLTTFLDWAEQAGR